VGSQESVDEIPISPWAIAGKKRKIGQRVEKQKENVCSNIDPRAVVCQLTREGEKTTEMGGG